MSGVAEQKVDDWTEERLEALSDDGYLHEVVNGELVMSPRNSFQHENICTRLLVALQSFNRTHRLGVVRGSSAGGRWEKIGGFALTRCSE